MENDGQRKTTPKTAPQLGKAVMAGVTLSLAAVALLVAPSPGTAR